MKLHKKTRFRVSGFRCQDKKYYLPSTGHFIWSSKLQKRRAGHRARPAAGGIGTVADTTFSFERSFWHWSDWPLFGQRQRSYETTFKANRRISNIEPQNVEVWNRFAQSF